jgi:hypothetical protein
MKTISLSNPDYIYRVLKIDHHLCMDINHAKKRMTDLKNKGYGGVVTNVAFDDYLSNPEYMNTFSQVVRYAKEIGMRVWIYDELGYPSGTAGGLTLKANDEYEAKALCATIIKVNSGDEIVIEKAKNHDFLTAYAFPINESKKESDNQELLSKPEDVYVDAIIGERICLDGYLDENHTLCYIPNETSLVCYFQTKHLYEGTHAQHNVHASRRYISVASKDAVREFISNTYEKYTKSVGDLYGNHIEAYFTDEPSYMAGYLNKGLYPPWVDDPYDDSIPLLPVVNWDTFVRDEFFTKYGYDIYDNLHYLFAGTNNKAQKIRLDYNSLLSDLYYEAYFKQIGDYCENNNVHFSGHLLLEENILHHGIYEGNVFRLIGKMGIPGIDMLTTIPEEVLKWAQTPKLISSSAKWHKKQHVMTEASGHMQGAANKPIDLQMMIGSCATQFALGVDTFTSYYNDNVITDEENRIFNTFVARLCNMFDGGSEEISTAIYYPIESVWVSTKGSDNQLDQREYGIGALKLEESWRGIIYELLNHQVEFDCLDANAVTESGITYSHIVVPRILSIPDFLYDRLDNLAKDGVTIIFHETSEMVKEKIEKLSTESNVMIVDKIEDIARTIKDNTSKDIEIDSNRGVVVKSKNNVKIGFDRVVFFVNTNKDKTNVTVDINKECELKIYDPLENTFVNYDSQTVNFLLGGYQSKILCIDWKGN